MNNLKLWAVMSLVLPALAGTMQAGARIGR